MSVRAGKDLPMKLIDLVKNFYELAVTSVTNIPMKVYNNQNALTFIHTEPIIIWALILKGGIECK